MRLSLCPTPPPTSPPPDALAARTVTLEVDSDPTRDRRGFSRKQLPASDAKRLDTVPNQVWGLRLECLRGPPVQERMNCRDSDERRWDPGRAGQVGRHLARRLRWRGETPSCSPRHRHPSAAASQTAPLSRRREETSSSVHVTTQGNKHRRHQWHQSSWAARRGGRKQMAGGSGRTPQGWSSSGRAVFTFSLLCKCTRGSRQAVRRRLHHFLPPSTQPQSPKRLEEKDRNKPQSQRTIKVLQTPQKSAGEAVVLLMLFTG